MSASVAIVIPVYRFPVATERLSLLLALRILRQYEIVVLLPDEFPPLNLPVKVKRFPRACFDSTLSYGRLMVDIALYEQFADFDYILVYQLDCLVFSDSLSCFCSLDCDWIAPLILGRHDGFWPDKDIVGVGGLSLRKVSSFLRVLGFLERPDLQAEAKDLEGRLQRNGAEDMFWSLSASTVDPSFSVAPSEVALAFGFEGDPRPSHRRADLQQPFGCHHWNRLSYFLWYLRWIRLPLRLWLRYIPPVLVELFFVEARDQLSRVRRRLSRITAGDSATSRSMLN